MLRSPVIHVHDWWIEERRIGGSVMRSWRCRAPGCRSPGIAQVTGVGAPYPDLPETEEVTP
jgi:hypothetical protein